MMDLRTSLGPSIDLEGYLGRRFASPGWWVPAKVDVATPPDGEGDRICWIGPFGHRARPASGLLGKFLALAAAGPEKIQQFARQWGLLGARGLALPDDVIEWLESDAEVFRGPPVAEGLAVWTVSRILEHGGWEAVDAWRYFARQAVALLRVAEALRRGEAGAAEDVRKIYHPAPLPEVWSEGTRLTPVWVAKPELLEAPPTEPSMRAHRRLVERWVRRWLDHGRVALRFEWTGLHPSIQFGGYGLLGALAIQLAQTASGREGLRICAACGKPYVAVGRQLRYCKGCGLPAAQRIASKTYRRREKASALAQAGFAVKEIAKRCETDQTTIRRWLRERKGSTRRRNRVRRSALRPRRP